MVTKFTDAYVHSKARRKDPGKTKQMPEQLLLLYLHTANCNYRLSIARHVVYQLLILATVCKSFPTRAREARDHGSLEFVEQLFFAIFTKVLFLRFYSIDFTIVFNSRLRNPSTVMLTQSPSLLFMLQYYSESFLVGVPNVLTHFSLTLFFSLIEGDGITIKPTLTLIRSFGRLQLRKQPSRQYLPQSKC